MLVQCILQLGGVMCKRYTKETISSFQNIGTQLVEIGSFVNSTQMIYKVFENI